MLPARHRKAKANSSRKSLKKKVFFSVEKLLQTCEDLIPHRFFVLKTVGFRELKLLLKNIGHFFITSGSVYNTFVVNPIDLNTQL
jgi:hypothetical protein